MLFRRRTEKPRQDILGYNPNRTDDLFALTTDGYIIAQDVVCQTEYVQNQLCLNCQHQTLTVIAKINRSFQGLNEMVAICTHCHERYSFIFDISNDIYQAWLMEQMGDLYSQSYDGPPRVAAPNQH